MVKANELKITDIRVADINGLPKHMILVKVFTNSDIVGYGEVRDASSATYVKMLKGRLVGMNPLNVNKVFERIKQFGGHSRQGGGVCAIEIACWDIIGKFYGVPVYQLLCVYLDDEVTGCRLTLYYTVYPDHDIISRYFSVENKGKRTVKIERAMSLCLDLPRNDLDMLTLYGTYFWEMNTQRVPLHYGTQSVGSRRSSSSHNFNPFMALVDRNAMEERGDV